MVKRLLVLLNLRKDCDDGMIQTNMPLYAANRGLGRKMPAFIGVSHESPRLYDYSVQPSDQISHKCDKTGRFECE